MLKKKKVHYSCTQIFDLITSNWAVCLSVASVITLLLGYLIFGVSPLYTFQEIAYQQQQDNLKREFVQFHNELGTQFLYVEQINAARDEFNQVLKVDPLNQDATRGLFECDVFKEAKNKSYDPEITNKKLNALRKENPNDPLPYLYLGDFFLNQGLIYNQSSLIDNAIDFYQEAINLDSSVAAAHAGMGQIYYERGQIDLAQKEFEKAVNLSNWNVVYRGDLAYICYELKDYQNSLYWYNGTIILDAKYLEPYVGYSNSYRCLGDLENALELQEKQIRLLEDNSTENITVNQEAFYYYTNLGNIINIYSYDVKKYYFYYNIALTYYLLGNETKTLEYLKKADDLHIDKDSESNVKEILNSDIENLQKSQPKFMNKTIEFKNKFK